MLQFVYAIDRDGVMGYETEGPDGKPVFKQPVISRVDREFYNQNTTDTVVLMGGNTLRAIIAEFNGNLNPARMGSFAVFTRDEELVEFARNQGVNVLHLRKVQDLIDFLEKPSDERISVIGGPSLFRLIESLDIQVDKHIVTEFDLEANPTEKPSWVAIYKAPGSCIDGTVEEGWFRRVDCKKFEDVDQFGNPISGYFAEYEVM